MNGKNKNGQRHEWMNERKELIERLNRMNNWQIIIIITIISRNDKKRRMTRRIRRRERKRRLAPVKYDVI